MYPIPESRILGTGDWILDPGPRILGPESWVHDPGSWILDAGSSVQEPGSSVQEPGYRIRDLNLSKGLTIKRRFFKVVQILGTVTDDSAMRCCSAGPQASLLVSPATAPFRSSILADEQQSHTYIYIYQPESADKSEGGNHFFFRYLDFWAHGKQSYAYLSMLIVRF